MGILEAILLGILQGLTEFLPISSTAHLTIAGHLLGLINMEQPQQWTAFLAVVQMGTLAAVLLYFAKDIAGITSDFLKQAVIRRQSFAHWTLNARLGWWIIVGSIPIGVVGLAAKKLIEGHLTKDPVVIGSALIGLAVVLWIAERLARFTKDLAQIRAKEALTVGIAQVFALIPGASRSGTTITGGLLVGLKRDVAARFSFLLSIPAVFASGVLEFWQLVDQVPGDQLFNVAVATVAAALSGYAAIAFLLSYLRTHTTMVFVVYRIVLGALVIGLLS